MGVVPSYFGQVLLELSILPSRCQMPRVPNGRVKDSEGVRHPVARAEMAPLAVALVHWRCALANHKLEVFVDNLAVMHAA
eukprot:5648515-Amphidinium_carterae.1